MALGNDNGKADRDDHDERQVSEGPSGFGEFETSTGGADAVPGTPDATPSTDLGEGDVERDPGNG